MFKTILQQIAILQLILGGVILVPGVVAVIYGEWYSLLGFCISSLMISGIAYGIYKSLKNVEDPQYQQSLMIAALGWLMIIVMGSIPYYMIAQFTPLEVMQSFVPSQRWLRLRK